MNKARMIKAVIIPQEIKVSGGFGLARNSNIIKCDSCLSPLAYARIEWGVVAQEYDYGIIGNRSNRQYNLTEVGLILYCAECGDFINDYHKSFYPEDKLVLFDIGMFDEIDDDERAEVECCLNQWNQKGNFTSRYNNPLFKELKEKLIEYEKKYPIKQEEKKKK